MACSLGDSSHGAKRMTRRVLSSAARGLALLGALAGGCGGERPDPGPYARDTAMSIPVEVVADSGDSRTLAIEPPPVRAWVTRVTPARGDPAAIPPPEPVTEPPSPGAPPGLTVDPGLKPPIPRTVAALRLRTPARNPASVELDVRVDETGRVAEARWAGGSGDSGLVRVAIESARGMLYHPALRGGRPVAVWCRQRFDFR